MYDSIYLINEAIHASLCDHLWCNFLSLTENKGRSKTVQWTKIHSWDLEGKATQLTKDRNELLELRKMLINSLIKWFLCYFCRRNFQQCSKFFKSYVVVQFASRQQVVLDHSSVEDAGACKGESIQHFTYDSIQISSKFFSLTISCGGFLVRHQHGCKLLQLVASDNAVQVHLLQDSICGQLLTALILEEGGQHAGTLLAWNRSSWYETDLYFTHKSVALHHLPSSWNKEAMMTPTATCRSQYGAV